MLRGKLKRSYGDDISLIQRWYSWALLILFFLGLALMPEFLKPYRLYILSLCAINSIVAIGLNILIGYTGQISLGHAGFFAIGAYASALFVKGGVPFIVSLPLAGCISALFGCLVGIPALRLKGPYLAVATLGFGIAVHQVLTNWELLSGGRMGLFVPKPVVFGHTLSSEAALYYLTVTSAAVLTLLAFALMQSHIGRALTAIRDSDIAAEMAGVSLTYYKLLSFVVSAFYTGIGGGLMGHLLGYVEPQMFTIFESIYYLSMVVVGGLASIPGSIFGGVIMTLIPQLLAGYKEYLPIIYGGIIMGIMTFEPLGLYGRWMKVRLYWKTWPF